MPGTLSSTETDSFIGAAAVVALGRRLVEQLDDGHDDIALSWMAHHVARRIKEAEVASDEDRHDREDRCRRAILDLWKARHTVFDPVPLGEMEQIADAIRALKDGENWFFNRRPIAGKEALPRAIHLAQAVDEGARSIIRTLVADAVVNGLAKEADWLSVAPNHAPAIQMLIEEAAIAHPGEDDPGAEYPVPGDADTNLSERSHVASERDRMVHNLRIFAELADEIAQSLQNSSANAL